MFVCSGILSAQEADTNWAERFPSKMTPSLEQALEEIAPGKTLEIYAVMKHRMPFSELSNMVSDSPLKDRHKVLSKALRSYSLQSQKNVIDALAVDGDLPGKAVKVLWISNSLHFKGTVEDIEKIRALPEVGYLGLVRDFPIESYQDANPGFRAAGIPFYDGFESGSFGPDWTTASTATGVVQVTTSNGPIGSYHVTMDSSTSGSTSTGSMTLTLDLSGVTNCYLDFMFKEFGDETDPEDNVSISEDGVTYYTVLGLTGGSTYDQRLIDLDKAASKNGISFSSNFKIRFSWKDNYPIPTDGFAFDEINVLPGDPPPAPPEPNIVKLQASQCWAVGVKGDGALILNIDSGVDYNHTDLVSQIWSNPGEAPFGVNGIDDDNNGYIDDFNGWDFESNDNDPYPSSYHGTATAGIVCGDGTAGSITGMAPEATMAIAKISGETDYWDAQQYAVLIGANAITSSYSYKWGSMDPDYHMFRTNSEIELLAGILHANSIGNQGTSPSSYPIPFNISTPGNCPGPWIHPDQVKGGVTSIMACGGVELDESLYTPSGQGPSAWEDMVIYDPSYSHTQKTEYWDYPYGGFSGGQPGLLKPDICTYTNVKTTDMGGGYRSSFGGTSAATPHLGGAICLLRSGNPYASPRKISQALQETAEDKGPVGKDVRYGAGKVQVFDALLRILHNMQFNNHEPSIGSSVDLEISGPVNRVYIMALSLTTGSTPIPKTGGEFGLGMPITFLLAGIIPSSGEVVYNVPIPNDTSIIGAKFYIQGLLDNRKGSTGSFLYSLVESLEIMP